MPAINSFCVIVTDKENKVLFWNRPTDLDSARALYRKKCAEFLGSKEEKRAFNMGPGEMYSGTVFDLHDAYTNKGIEKKIKEWGGDLTIAVSMATNISYEIYNKPIGVTIRLLHSTKT